MKTQTVLAESRGCTAFHGFYNQLKQEYAAARWPYYEATELAVPGFVDRKLNLLDTLDRSVFGVQLEKVKLAMRLPNNGGRTTRKDCAC